MGNLRGLKKKLAGVPIAMVDAHVAVNDCQVFVGHINPKQAQATAKKFKLMMGKSIARSKQFTIGDMYNAHFQMCQQLKEGKTVEEIWN
jgi:hypothetical protein